MNKREDLHCIESFGTKLKYKEKRKEVKNENRI